MHKPLYLLGYSKELQQLNGGLLAANHRFFMMNMFSSGIKKPPEGGFPQSITSEKL
jgi:hypothetical protein